MHPAELHHTPAARLRENATGFDFDVLDSPIDLAHEDLERVLGRCVPRADVERLWRWHLHQSVADRAAERAVAERILIWIGGGRPLNYVASGKGGCHASETVEQRAERRLGLRAAVAIREVTPHAEQHFSVKSLGKIFGVSANLVHELALSFRRSVDQAALPPELPND